MVKTRNFLLYDELTLTSYSGMLTVEPLPLIPSGRAVQFVLPDAGQAKEIYTLFDGELAGPFRNGSQMSTPIKLWESLVPRPHNSLVAVVDLRPTNLNNNWLPMQPLCFAVNFDHGETGQLHSSPRMQGRIRCRHPRQLVEAWLSGLISQPEEAVACALTTAAADLLPSWAANRLATCAPAQATSVLASGTHELAHAISTRAQQALPWMQVLDLMIELPVDNIDQLTQTANRPFEIGLQTRQKVMDAILSVYTRDTFSPQIAQILLGYAQANPGITEAELIVVSEKLLSLTQKFSPQQILSTSIQLGLLPPSTGQNP